MPRVHEEDKRDQISKTITSQGYAKKEAFTKNNNPSIMIEVRTEKKTNPYVMIDNRPLNDRGLSYGARGLLSYLLSKPDDWNIKMHDLVNGPDGAHKVRGYLKELQKAGYAYLKRSRDEKGRVLGSEWIIREEPNPGLQKTESRETIQSDQTGITKNRKPEKPNAEKPETGKSAYILSTEFLQRTEKLNTESLQMSEDAPEIFDPVQEIKSKILCASSYQKEIWKARFSADPESLVVDAEDFAAWWISKQDGKSENMLNQHIKRTTARVFQMSFQSSWLNNKAKYKSRKVAAKEIMKSEDGLAKLGIV